jgi:hypothetical protein
MILFLKYCLPYPSCFATFILNGNILQNIRVFEVVLLSSNMTLSYFEYSC